MNTESLDNTIYYLEWRDERGGRVKGGREEDDERNNFIASVGVWGYDGTREKEESLRRTRVLLFLFYERRSWC